MQGADRVRRTKQREGHRLNHQAIRLVDRMFNVKIAMLYKQSDKLNKQNSAGQAKQVANA